MGILAQNILPPPPSKQDEKNSPHPFQGWKHLGPFISMAIASSSGYKTPPKNVLPFSMAKTFPALTPLVGVKPHLPPTIL